jgi:hypothetical protein
LGSIDVTCFLDGGQSNGANNFITVPGPLSLEEAAIFPSSGTMTLYCHNGLTSGGFVNRGSLDNVHLDAIQVGAVH